MEAISTVSGIRVICNYTKTSCNFILPSEPAVVWLGMYHFHLVISWCCANSTFWNLKSHITQCMTVSSSCIVTYYPEFSLHWKPSSKISAISKRESSCLQITCSKIPSASTNLCNPFSDVICFGSLFCVVDAVLITSIWPFQP